MNSPSLPRLASALLASGALLAPALAQDPAASPPPAAPGGGAASERAAEHPVASTIDGVTVYPEGAAVRRRATLPAGGGTFVLAGLPATLDADGVQVRLQGAEIVSVEVRDGVRAQESGTRIAELQAQLRDKERELEELRDRRAVLKRMDGHLAELLGEAAESHADDVRAARPDVDAWEKDYDWLRSKLEAQGTEARELGWKEEELKVAQQALQTELGRCQAESGVRVKDLVLDVEDTSGSPASLEVEYVVPQAGWAPLYDLRAAQDLASVELVHRAKVWQRSGEDWRDVEVVLSTARPQSGARGPELQGRWLSLAEPMGASKLARLRDLGYTGGEARPASPGPADTPAPEESTFAEVAAAGTSVRYRLPRRETIETRVAPTSVLVGRATLAVTAEHVCVPELDTTVWLRARAKNTSPWVLLPGRAAIYFGTDFVGAAQLDEVAQGADFDLHLGPDPGLDVERVKLADVAEQPGLFGSHQSRRETWRVRIANHGGLSTRPDGRVDVIVQEVLPRSKDERIEVELSSAKPAPSEEARWKRERKEQGILTWVLPVEAGHEASIEHTREVSWPEDRTLASSR